MSNDEEARRVRAFRARSNAVGEVERQRRLIRELEGKNRMLEAQIAERPPNVIRTLSAPLTLGTGSIQFMVELTVKE